MNKTNFITKRLVGSCPHTRYKLFNNNATIAKRKTAIAYNNISFFYRSYCYIGCFEKNNFLLNDLVKIQK